MSFKIKIGDVSIYHFTDENILKEWCENMKIPQETKLGWYLNGTISQINVVSKQINEYVKSVKE